jgi:hypothetical protein
LLGGYVARGAQNGADRELVVVAVAARAIPKSATLA